MATLKATILQNFATIGIPDFDEETEPVSKNWSIIGLSENLIDEDRLVGLQHLNTRRLDLVIHNGSKFALLNLQAFKIFECEVATNTIRPCLTHYLTPDGNLLFGVQPSGDVVILTDGLQKVKQVRKPAFIKFQQKQPKWYEDIPGKLAEFFGGGSKSKCNQVSPEPTLHGVQIIGGASTTATSASIPFPFSSGLSQNFKILFPYLTSLSDGLAILCAFSPTDCYIFLSSYETALRMKTIANIKGNQVPGRWYRIIMHKSSIAKWLEDRRTTPFFEARLCYKKGADEERVVGGAMLYGVMEDLKLELVYGIIKRRTDKFTLTWEMMQFEVDWAVRENNGRPYNMGAKCVAKLSSDCTKMVIVISNHLGMYIHVEDIRIPSDAEQPIHMKRQRVSLCNHSDYDGCHFYQKECWISDVQWLVEDAYFAVMTLCGSLSIFYNSGEPMLVKVRKPGPEYDEDKSARFYFPVFHPHQIVSSKQYQQQHEPNGDQSDDYENTSSSLTPQQSYPTIKWIDSEQVLTCSSGMKIELFSIQRVIPIRLEDGQSEIWLGESKSDVIYIDNPHASSGGGRSTLMDDHLEDGEEGQYGTASYSSFASSHRSTVMRPAAPGLKLKLKPAVNVPGPSNISRDNLEQGQSSPILEYRYSREENEYRNEYNPEFDMTNDDVDVYPINDVESPSRIEELPPDGGEIVEENLENSRISEAFPTPETLRRQRNEKFLIKNSENQLGSNEAPILSMPESLAQVEATYNADYSDVSSEPDISGNCELTTGPPQESSSLPYIETIDVAPSTLRKRSQQYMADDEADDVDDTTANHRRSMRRKPFGGKPSVAFLVSRERTPTRSSSPPPPREETDHCPRSSSAHETEFSRETYSSPFSYAPTSAEDNDDSLLDADDEQERIHNVGDIRSRSTERSRPQPIIRSQSSTTTVSLQIPPVPVISGVIVPSERQSAVLMQSLEPDSSTMQPELMRYKPPPTTNTATAEPSNIDILHFKSKSAGMMEKRDKERDFLPLEKKSDYDRFEVPDDDGQEEEGEDEEHEDIRSTLDGSADISNFSTTSRYRNSSV